MAASVWRVNNIPCETCLMRLVFVIVLLALNSIIKHGLFGHKSNNQPTVVLQFSFFLIPNSTLMDTCTLVQPTEWCYCALTTIGFSCFFLILKTDKAWSITLWFGPASSVPMILMASLKLFIHGLGCNAELIFEQGYLIFFII